MVEISQITPKQRGPGRPFRPGESGNPGGRPAVSHPATRLMELTDQGQDVVDFVLSVFRGQAGREWEHPKYRIWATEWIADRLWGRPLQSMRPETDSTVRIVVTTVEGKPADKAGVIEDHLLGDGDSPNSSNSSSY